MSGARMLDAIRLSNGELPAYAWPGGYPMLYVTRDGLAVCPTCANRDSSDLLGYDVNWEDADAQCDDCNAAIPSAYGADND